MKTLNDLTPEIKAKIPLYKEKCTKDLYSGVEFENFNKKDVDEYIEKVYELAKFEKPFVIIAQDPLDYGKKFMLLKEQKNLIILNDIYEENKSKNPDAKKLEKLETQLNESLDEDLANFNRKIEKVESHFLFLCSSYHRVYLTWFKFIQDEFKIDHKNKETLDWFYKRAFNNISRCYFTKLFVLVLRMPKRIRRNDVGFHSVDKPSIEWNDYQMYYINGRKLEKKYFDAVSNKTMTFDEFLEIDNEDTKASIISMVTEKFGEEYLMEFLNAQKIDEHSIVHSSGHMENVALWKTNTKYTFLSDINGNSNQPYAWLDLTCPTSGSKYLIPTSAHFESALEACKFHRPEKVEMDLEYDFKEFNN